MPEVPRSLGEPALALRIALPCGLRRKRFPLLEITRCMSRGRSRPHGVRACSSIKSVEAAFVSEFPSAKSRDLRTCLAVYLRLGCQVSVHVGGWDTDPETNVGGGRRELVAASVF